MSQARWRGTLIYAGTVAAVAAVSAARFAGAGAAQADEPTSPPPTAPATPAATPSSYPTPVKPTPTPSPTATPDPVQPQPDGTVLVVGDDVLTRYGTLQLAVTFAGRDIVAVDVLQSPDWEPNSITLNQTVLPLLTNKAVETDSATGLNAISGATYTSEAYRLSLQSAIDLLG